MREGAISLVSGANLYTVLCCEFRSADESFNASQDGYWVVERSERVHAYVKAEVYELFSDVVGEAAAEHCDFVAV